MSRRNIILAVVLAAVAAVAIAFAVFSTREAPKQEAPKQEVYVFIPTVENPFWLTVRGGVESAAQENAGDFTVTILEAETTDAATQVEQMRNALERGRVRAIVFAPTNDRAPAPIVARYNRAGIPVVMIDTELDRSAAQSAGARYDVFIGSDNRLGGRMAAQAMLRALGREQGRSRVLLLKGSYVHQSGVDRAEGFIEAARGQLEIIERDGEWSRQRATELTASVFARGRVDGIFASNDEMALGAIAALRRSGVPQSEWPIIIGFDATAEAQQAIRGGTMYGSIRQQAREMGRRGFLAAIQLTRGGTGRATRLLVPVDLVTAENLNRE
jgi:ribose transport system substrate-binding protein/ribose transport system permease protein